MSPQRVLIVDDDRNLLRIIEAHFIEAGYETSAFVRAAEALETIRKSSFDLALVDLKMPEMNGIEFLAEIREIDPEIPVIIITAHATVSSAVEAMKRGAYDYVTKPFRREEILLVAEKALNHRKLLDENLRLKKALSEGYGADALVGRSPAMKEIREKIRLVAESGASVLITGESGTGKELVARAIHYEGQRAAGPFIALNCGAIPAGLVESELFGHVRGAFTGAHKDKPGKFELADGGTLFLDEVGDMPPETQAKLLRILERKEVERVGGQKLLRVDVRVISATHRDLKEKVASDYFREDLYYRLNVFPIHIPPLRERRDDIPLLLEHSLQRCGASFTEITPDALEVLKAYDWPGNVRELENAVERALILKPRAQTLILEDFPEQARDTDAHRGPLRIEIPEEGVRLEDVEKELIREALEKAGGNQSRAADLLGITRQTLIYRMRKHSIS